MEGNEQKGGMVIKGQQERSVGDRTVLHLDCGGTYTNLYMKNYTELNINTQMSTSITGEI